MEMKQIQKAIFLDRPNRFIAHVDLNGQVVTCHMPNPGRMWELLFQGTTVYVRPAENPKRKTPYDVVGIERDGTPILLVYHSTITIQPLGSSKTISFPAGRNGTSFAAK